MIRSTIPSLLTQDPAKIQQIRDNILNADPFKSHGNLLHAIEETGNSVFKRMPRLTFPITASAPLASPGIPPVLHPLFRPHTMPLEGKNMELGQKVTRRPITSYRVVEHRFPHAPKWPRITLPKECQKRHERVDPALFEKMGESGWQESRRVEEISYAVGEEVYIFKETRKK